MRDDSNCTVDGCPSPRINSKVCANHYKAARLGEISIPGYKPKPFPDCEAPECSNRGTKSGYCPAHYKQRRRKGGTTRVQFQAEMTCSVDVCAEPALAKNLCAAHYHRKRAAERGLRTTECTTLGCATRVRVPGLCGPHAKVQEKARKRELGDRECIHPACDGRVSHWSKDLCRKHGAAKQEKGLSMQQYLELAGTTACEACGGVEKLVTDHKHGHHTRDSQMCPECIRGMLCNGCNSALGYLGEDEARIEGLLAYIRRFHGDPVRSGA